MNYAERLKSIRLENELTQAQLAKNANLATSCIAMIELGKREPSANTLISLAKALNVTSDYLLGLEDDFGQKGSFSPNTYSAEEHQLIEDYRTLSPALKKMLQDTIQTWKRSEANKKLKA